MATLGSNLSKVEQEELTEDSDSDVDENSNDDVEVNIAIVGQAGSGRSSFVNAILRCNLKFLLLCSASDINFNDSHVFMEA
jgi:predicted GTPase